jgi:hypothetical protein
MDDAEARAQGYNASRLAGTDVRSLPGLDLGGDMPTLTEVIPTLKGFGTFAALPEEQISEKISRRVLCGDHGMIVWWSIGSGVHVQSYKHPGEQIMWVLKGEIDFRKRKAGLRAGRHCRHSGI